MTVSVPKGYRQTVEYRRHRFVLKNLTDEAILERIELAAQSPHSIDKYGFLLDFAPTANYARRLVSGPLSRSNRLRLALAALSRCPGHRGRPRSQPLTEDERGRIMAERQRWQQTVADVWDRATDKSSLASTLLNGFKASAAHRRALLTLLRRPWVRPCDLDVQLTAWSLGISVRRVRSAIANDVTIECVVSA